MVRVWIYGGGRLCSPLAHLLKAIGDGTNAGRGGGLLRQLSNRLLHGGEIRTHCSPGASPGQTADEYAEEQIGSALERLNGLDALIFLADHDTGASVVEAATSAAGGFLASSREAVRAMARQGVGGNLICVCDIAGVAGRGHRAAAATGSGALLGMARALAKELGRQDISVNALACGPMEIPGQPVTPLTEQETRLFASMGIGQPVQPNQLATTLGLLVRGGHGMTGQVLHLDRGLVI